MTTLISTFSFCNRQAKPHVVAVEPWGEDFTLLPGESLEILAMSESVQPSFEVVEWADCSQVYCNDAADFKVMQGGVQLECGHKRRQIS